MQPAPAPNLKPYTTSQQLALNLLASMRVAGPPREDGRPGPLRAVKVQRDVGIARSTLRALKRGGSDGGHNPDLSTVSRLADQLGIPVAFLLMRPQDWDALRLAINGIRDHLAAADLLVDRQNFGGEQVVEKVLRQSGVHPERPPIGEYDDKPGLARLEARNEWRRRTSHVLAALMQAGARSRDAHVMLTALAAAFANQTTPHDPTNS